MKTFLSYTNIFPNHKKHKGQEIFFFLQGVRKHSFTEQLTYFMEILKHLKSTSAQGIEFRIYMSQIQKYLLTKKTQKTIESMPDCQNDYLIRVCLDNFTADDTIAHHKKRFFGDSKMMSRPVAITVGSGKKARRFIDMAEQLCKTHLYADYVARMHFNHLFTSPDNNEWSFFINHMSEFVALSKYIVAISDSGEAGNNVTTFRLLAIVTKAALCLDQDDLAQYHHILDNPFIG